MLNRSLEGTGLGKRTLDHHSTAIRTKSVITLGQCFKGFSKSSCI